MSQYLLRRGRAIVGCCVVILALSACAQEAESTGLPSPGSAPDSTESPSPGSTPTPESQEYAEVPTDLKLSEGEKEAAREALVTVDEYYEYYFEVMTSGGEEYERLSDYASDAALRADEDAASELREAKEKVEGEYEIRDFDVSKIDLDPSDGTSLPFIEVGACVDITESGLIDEEGESLVAPDRADTFAHTFLVAQYDVGWRVSRKDVEDQRC